jgi:hypothetical protein
MIGWRDHFLYGDFYLFFKTAMDTFFPLTLGVAAAALTRAGSASPLCSRAHRAEKLHDNWENRAGYRLPLTLLVLIPITGLMREGTRINLPSPWYWWHSGSEIKREFLMKRALVGE